MLSAILLISVRNTIFFLKKRQEMIGIKIENNFLEKMLLDLLKEKAELWKKGHFYSVVLTDLPIKKLQDFQKEEKIKLIVLGRKEPLFYSLPMPFKLEDLEKALTEIFNIYENNIFLWDSTHRQLKNKKTDQLIQLTEKEANLIDFLRKNPHQKATKEELLKNVWKYTNDTETHTIESTIYTLRKKTEPYSNQIIKSNKYGYRLV